MNKRACYNSNEESAPHTIGTVWLSNYLITDRIHLFDIPEGPLLQILSNLTKSRLNRFGLCSKRCSRLSNTNSLWKNLFINNFPEISILDLKKEGWKRTYYEALKLIWKRPKQIKFSCLWCWNECEECRESFNCSSCKITFEKIWACANGCKGRKSSIDFWGAIVCLECGSSDDYWPGL